MALSFSVFIVVSAGRKSTKNTLFRSQVAMKDARVLIWEWRKRPHNNVANTHINSFSTTSKIGYRFWDCPRGADARIRISQRKLVWSKPVRFFGIILHPRMQVFWAHFEKVQQLVASCVVVGGGHLQRRTRRSTAARTWSEHAKSLIIIIPDWMRCIMPRPMGLAQSAPIITQEFLLVGVRSKTRDFSPSSDLPSENWFALVRADLQFTGAHCVGDGNKAFSNCRHPHQYWNRSVVLNFCEMADH